MPDEVRQTEDALAALVERMYRTENERDALRAENQDLKAQLADAEPSVEVVGPTRLPGNEIPND